MRLPGQQCDKRGCTRPPAKVVTISRASLEVCASHVEWAMNTLLKRP